MKQNKVSVLTKQNIRYEGFVYAIDKIRKTVFLKEVKCFGTEEREANIFIPPSNKITPMAEFSNDQIQEIKKIVLLVNEIQQNIDAQDQKQLQGIQTHKEQQKTSQREKQTQSLLNQSCTYEITKSPLPKINQQKGRHFHSQSPEQKYNLLSQKPVYITNNYLQLKKMEQYKKLLQFRHHH